MKRVRKALKTKDGSSKKSGKSVQECANGLEGKGIEEVAEAKEVRRGVLLGRGVGETMVRQVSQSRARAGVGG